MSTLRRLTWATLLVALGQVALGAFTRGSGSGFGCRDRWPLCEGGALGGLLPRADFHMVVEWSHRWVASVLVVLVVALVVVAWRRHRHERAVTGLAGTALLTVLVQAGIGAWVVKADLDADLVSLHLLAALLLLALLAAVAVRSGGALGGEPDPRWRLAVGGVAALVLVVAVLGSTVHDTVAPGWPLVDTTGGPLDATAARHLAHRLGVGVALVALLAAAGVAIRRSRPRHEIVLVHGALAAFVANIAVGAGHVLTDLPRAGLVSVHLLLAATAWTLLVAAAAGSPVGRAARAPRPAPAAAGAGR